MKFTFLLLLLSKVITLDGVGYLKVQGNVEGVELYVSNVEKRALFVEGFRVVEKERGDTLFLYLEKERLDLFGKFGILRSRAKVYLPGDLPVWLDFSLSGNRAKFDLRFVRLRELSLSLSASKVRVRFPELPAEPYSLNIFMSLSRLELEYPAPQLGGEINLSGSTVDIYLHPCSYKVNFRVDASFSMIYLHPERGVGLKVKKLSPFLLGGGSTKGMFRVDFNVRGFFSRVSVKKK